MTMIHIDQDDQYIYLSSMKTLYQLNLVPNHMTCDFNIKTCSSKGEIFMN